MTTLVHRLVEDTMRITMVRKEVMVALQTVEDMVLRAVVTMEIITEEATATVEEALVVMAHRGAITVAVTATGTILTTTTATLAAKVAGAPLIVEARLVAHRDVEAMVAEAMALQIVATRVAAMATTVVKALTMMIISAVAAIQEEHQEAATMAA